jgi:hypothetical protein
MVKRKTAQPEPTHSEIEAAVVETAEKAAAPLASPIASGACTVCGGQVALGARCPTDGQVN